MPLRALTMRKGDHVRWYLFAGMNDFDFHTPHWHGNTVSHQSDAHRCHLAGTDADGHGRHGAGRRRHLALALSHLLPQCGGYERQVPRYAVTLRVARWGRSLSNRHCRTLPHLFGIPHRCRPFEKHGVFSKALGQAGRRLGVRARGHGVRGNGACKEQRRRAR